MWGEKLLNLLKMMRTLVIFFNGEGQQYINQFENFINDHFFTTIIFHIKSEIDIPVQAELKIWNLMS